MVECWTVEYSTWEGRRRCPFWCARKGKKRILTNCADTARLVGRSRCCQSPITQRLVQSSLANLLKSREMCLWNISIQEDSAHTCDPPDVEETTSFPSEEDDVIRKWLGHPQNSTLAKMISDAGGSDEISIVRLDTRVRCASGCLGLGSGVLRQFQGPDSSMILCWLMCISEITRAARCWCSR